MIAHKVGMACRSTKEVAIKCQIPTSESRRLHADTSFIYKLLNNRIDCAELLEQKKNPLNRMLIM